MNYILKYHNCFLRGRVKVGYLKVVMSRQVACVPLFAALMAYEVYYGLEEEEGAVPMEHQVGEVGERPSL